MQIHRKTWITNLFYIYIFIISIDALLKYITHYFGVEFIIYLLKIIILGFLFLISFQKKYLLGYSLILSLVFLYSTIGLLNNLDIRAVLFNVYRFIPFIVGFVMSRYIYELIHDKSFYYYSLFIIFIVSSGIFLDIFFELPWKGLSYSMGGAEVDVQRNFTNMGTLRPSGFSTISWDAASILAVFGLFLLLNIKSPHKKFFSFLFLLSVIILTTVKSIVGVFIILGSIFLINKKNVNKLIMTLSILVLIIIPLSTIYYEYSIGSDDFIVHLLIRSFEDRVENVWPHTLELIENTNYLVGGGFGMFGAASYRYEGLESSTDNMFLYIVGNFGLFGLFLFLFLFFKILITKNLNLYYLYLYIGILIYGIFVNLFEFGIWGLVFGLIVGKFYNLRMKIDY